MAGAGGWGGSGETGGETGGAFGGSGETGGESGGDSDGSFGGSGDDGGSGGDTGGASDDVVWKGVGPNQTPQDRADLERTRDVVYGRELSIDQQTELDSWQPNEKNWWFDDTLDEERFRRYHKLRALAETETGTLTKLNMLDYDETLGVRIESHVLDDGKPVDNLVINSNLRPDLLWRSKLIYTYTDALIAGRWNLFIGAYRGYPIESEGAETVFVPMDQLAAHLVQGPLSWLVEADRDGGGKAAESAETFVRVMLEELYPEKINGPDFERTMADLQAYQGALRNYWGHDLADEMRRVNGFYRLQNYFEERDQVDVFLDRLGFVEGEHFFNILMNQIGPRLVEYIAVKPQAEIAELVEDAELRLRGRHVSLPRTAQGPDPGDFFSVTSITINSVGINSVELRAEGKVRRNTATGEVQTAKLKFVGWNETHPTSGASIVPGSVDGNWELWIGVSIEVTPASTAELMSKLMHIKSNLEANISKDGDTVEGKTASNLCIGIGACPAALPDGLEHEANKGGKYKAAMNGSWTASMIVLPASFVITTETSQEWEVEVEAGLEGHGVKLTSSLRTSQGGTQGESLTFNLDPSLFSDTGSYDKGESVTLECEVIGEGGRKLSDSCECIDSESCGDAGIDIPEIPECPEAQPGSVEYCSCLEHVNEEICLECNNTSIDTGVTVTCTDSPGGFCPCSEHPQGCEIVSGSDGTIRSCRSRFDWVASDDEVLCVLNNASCDGGSPLNPYAKTIPSGTPQRLMACSNGFSWGPCPDQPAGLPVLSPAMDPAEGFPACHCVGGVPLTPGCSCDNVGSGPDLIIDWIRFSNETPSAGDPLQIVLSVRNVGNEVAPAAPMTVQLESPNGVEDLDTHTGSLAPGEHRVFEFVFDAPVAGLYRALVEVDPNNELFELSEENNLALSPDAQVAASNSGGHGIDLALSPLLTTPDNPTNEHEVELEFDLKNLGSQTALSTPYLVRVIGVDSQWEARGTLAELGPNSRETLVVDLPASGVGTYSVTVIADPENVHAETNEENNQQSRIVTVHDSGDPCLPCTSGQPNNQLGAEVCFPPSSESWYGDRFRCEGVRPDGSSCSPEGTAPNGWHHIGSSCPRPFMLPPGLHPDACGNPGVCIGASPF